MQSKQKAISQFCTLTQKQRDLMCAELETLQQQSDQANKRIEQLLDLKKQTRANRRTHLHREMLLNQCQVQGMLSKMVDHQQHELELVHAQYHSLQTLIKVKHIKVKGLENQLASWQREQKIVLQKNEDLALEEAINNFSARQLSGL